MASFGHIHADGYGHGAFPHAGACSDDDELATPHTTVEPLIQVCKSSGQAVHIAVGAFLNGVQQRNQRRIGAYPLVGRGPSVGQRRHLCAGFVQNGADRLTLRVKRSCSDLIAGCDQLAQD
ncbi:hypothetical protein D9M73_90590 [compost metagenome]